MQKPPLANDTRPIIETLAIKPHAQSVYTDFEKERTRITFFWRFTGRSRPSAVAFVDKVLDAVRDAKLIPGGRVSVDLTPVMARSWACYVSMQIEGMPMEGQEQEEPQ